MDTITTELLTFLAGGSIVATLLTGLLKQAFDDISARFGALITQGILFAVCLIIAFLINITPVSWLLMAGGMFAVAISLYEVLYKAIWQQAIKGNQ